MTVCGRAVVLPGLYGLWLYDCRVPRFRRHCLHQTLSSIMVQELCQSLYDDKEEMALALEDTTIVLAALVPWSVAAAVPLAALGASSWGIAAAVYLYLQPLWSWLRTSFRKREQGA